MDPVTIAVLITIGCGLFLAGCTAWEEENNENSSLWEPIPEDEIEEHLGVDEDDSPIVNYAKLRCTSGGENIVLLKNTSGNRMQRGTSATNLDVDLGEGGFIVCSTSSDKKCIPEIEENEWLCTNKNHTSNGCSEVTCTSFLFCMYGFGMIYVEESGQEEGEMKAFGAFYVMELWLNEGYDVVAEEQLTIALEDAKNYGGQNQVGNFKTYFENATKFDTSILAWTNFWNVKLKEELGEGNFTPVRAEVIKCMMAKESTMGDEGRKNSMRDVMQCLFPGDPGIWAITKIDPFASGKSHQGISEQVINIEQIDGSCVNGSLPPSGYNKNDTKLQEWFGEVNC